jgi:hypothetical protein
MQIMTLLAMYWTADESPEIRALVADAWLEDLEEFDAEILADACREWRRGQTHRPNIADIRKLCIEAQESRTLKLAPRKIMPEDEIAARADIWARNRGFASMAAMQRSPSFSGGSINIAPGVWRRIEPIREFEPVVVVTPVSAPTPTPTKPTPAWIVERDQKRAEDRAKALGIDKLDGMFERYKAASVEALKAKQAEFAQPDDIEPPAAPRQEEVA